MLKMKPWLYVIVFTAVSHLRPYGRNTLCSVNISAEILQDDCTFEWGPSHSGSMCTDRASPRFESLQYSHSRAGRGAAATQGIPAGDASPGSHPEETQDNSEPEASQTLESEKNLDKNDMGKDDNTLPLVDESKLDDGKNDDGKSSSGGGDGGGGDPDDNIELNDDATPENVTWYRRKEFIGAAVGTAIGAGAAVVAGPLVIGAMGFGAGGIVAGSYAAQMMAAEAMASGGAVGAGSLVATLQSIGTAGFGVAGFLGLGVAGASFGATVGSTVVTVADLVTGDRNETAQEAGEPQERAEGGDGAPTSIDPPAPMENLNMEGVNETQYQRTQEMLSIIVWESDGNVRRFSVMSSEPLQRMFDEYFHQTGLARDSVRFEFNGFPLDGLVSPEELGFESDDVVKALQI